MSCAGLTLPTVQPPGHTTNTDTDPAPTEAEITVIPSPEPTDTIEPDHADAPFELEDTKGRVAGAVFSLSSPGYPYSSSCSPHPTWRGCWPEPLALRPPWPL